MRVSDNRRNTDETQPIKTPKLFISWIVHFLRGNPENVLLRVWWGEDFLNAEFKIQELNNSTVNGKEKSLISVRIRIPYFIQFQMLWETIHKDPSASYY